MARAAFKMYLIKGQEAEYERRHDEIWPDLVELINAHGIYDYSISLDAETNTLFALQNLNPDNTAGEIGKSPLMQRWFQHMGGLLKTNPDGTPVVIPLREVFYMP